MSLRKKALVFALVAVAALMVPSIALANYAIHGNYVQDTDACAGCHRAHTSVSSITWQDNAGDLNSALLISSATSIQEFCYACHDGNSLGADTNVQDGVYLGNTNGVTGAVLNGGGFTDIAGTPVTSWHVTNSGSPVVKWGAWGGGFFTRSAVNTDTNGTPAADDPYTAEVGDSRSLGQSTAIKMDCTTCHDPHGSPNYRILKSMVLGNYVGGYQSNVTTPTDPNPDGWVSSVETGWPIGGFRLHTGYPQYQPNYTTAMYSKGYDMLPVALGGSIVTTNAAKGMSGWCVGCHSVYMTKESTYNAGDDYGNALAVGMALRHRHPINVPLSNYDGPDKASMIVTDVTVPLAHSPGTETGAPANRSEDWIECLTCHRAHGTAATTTGWANQLSAATGDEVPDFISRQSLIVGGVPFSEASNLLRYNNRGVCERCHNK
jgi:cytochrome c553